MRLLKEYTWRELIDVLSYGFDPLNGINAPPTAYSNRVQSGELMRRSRVARTSTLEVAIRAKAKKFLAHPLVAQHLEAIWQGNIVFNSVADNLHRLLSKPLLNQSRHYGATHPGTAGNSPYAEVTTSSKLAGEMIRRSVTLYDPGNASIFKLSRLRVPRYRQMFSTISFAVMLGLFLAVLIERPRDVTPLEIVFWAWSVGYMLDELVGFTEQGFALYIISVWNALDIGILIMLLIYYVLRIYGLFLTTDENKHQTANMAYDVLASTAVLLFPRLFSLLDHYRYFSQLLIAFRLMAQDLAAILFLIGIACSGFFIAFTLSFGRHDSDWSQVAYALFQILMGFTPAAWDVWFKYNFLGKAILALFLIICHFLVVTILITVLTNSFMAIVKNAEEEHQYLFAVNTISSVKSDALFSYIPPTNIIAWLFSPLRWCIPFRQFVRINRTIIKLTHFPVLAFIYGWERIMLLPHAYKPETLVENRGLNRGRIPFTLGGGTDIFSPGARLRRPSVAAIQEDRALDEVFRRPFNLDSTIRKVTPNSNRRESIVDTWMRSIGKEDGPHSPTEQPRGMMDRLETRRPSRRRAKTSGVLPARHCNKSPHSDPVEHRPLRPGLPITQPTQSDLTASIDGLTTPSEQNMGATESASGDDDGALTASPSNVHMNNYTSKHPEGDELTSTTPKASAIRRVSSHKHFGSASNSTPGLPKFNNRGCGETRHGRNAITNTILFSPVARLNNSSSSSSLRASFKPSSRGHLPTATRGGSPSLFRRESQRPTTAQQSTQPRPIFPGRKNYKSSSNVGRFLDLAADTDRRKPSVHARALDLASDIGDNRYITTAEGNSAHLLSTSFQTQLDFASQMKNCRNEEESNRVNRMILARMNTIEEGFKDILKEVKGLRSAGNSRGTGAAEESASVHGDC